VQKSQSTATQDQPIGITPAVVYHVVGFFDVAARFRAGDGPIAAIVGGSSCYSLCITTLYVVRLMNIKYHSIDFQRSKKARTKVEKYDIHGVVVLLQHTIQQLITKSTSLLY